MNQTVPSIGFSLSSLEDFERAELAADVLDVMLSSQLFKPLKWGIFDGKQPIYNSQELVRNWLNFNGNTNQGVVGKRAGSLVLKGKNISYQISWDKGSIPTFPFVAGDVPISALLNFPDRLEEFFRIIKELARRTCCVYGEVRNMSFQGWNTPMNLMKRLPDIPFISIYGRPYCHLFGENKIFNAPVPKIEKLSQNMFWLQLDGSVFDKPTQQSSDRLKSYLGKTSFMENGNWKYKDGIAPVFDYSNVLI